MIPPMISSRFLKKMRSWLGTSHPRKAGEAWERYSKSDPGRVRAPAPRNGEMKVRTGS